MKALAAVLITLLGLALCAGLVHLVSITLPYSLWVLAAISVGGLAFIVYLLIDEFW